MKYFIEWDCPRCGLVHDKVEMPAPVVKCPVCGIPQVKFWYWLCNQPVAQCAMCFGCGK